MRWSLGSQHSRRLVNGFHSLRTNGSGRHSNVWNTSKGTCCSQFRYQSYCDGFKFPKENPYTLSGAGTITVLGVGAGDPSFVNVTKGDHVINCGISLNNNTVFTVNIIRGASINFFASIMDVAASSLLVNGPGETNVNCTPTTGPVGISLMALQLFKITTNLTINNSAISTSQLLIAGYLQVRD